MTARRRPPPADPARADIVITVSQESDWIFDIPGAPVLAAPRYLTDPEWGGARRLRVFNLCRSYRYQSTGYYVSLLATARGHVPIPSLRTILDMRSPPHVRAVDEELDALIQRTLAPIKSNEFTLSVYFGENMAARYVRLATALFNQFPAPLLRAQFARVRAVRRNSERWQLRSLAPIPAREIPEGHRPFVVEAARRYFARPRFHARKRRGPRFHLAILHDPHEAMPPSDPGALRRFARAAEQLDFGVEFIHRDDFSRLAEFDALFIRETTEVNHHTYRFASRAEREGLVVVDDPQSILRCGNKVYLAEALQLHKIPQPRTLIVTRFNVDAIASAVGLPCVLKAPDSAFSKGVVRCDTPEDLEQRAQAILEESDLFVAQEYMPTEYDWRIGVFDRKPLYACRYHMAPGHWQIIKHDGGRQSYGLSDTMPVEQAPSRIVRMAMRAANLMGDGLYGVDLKQSGRRCVVMEVNDNPTIEAGGEDAVIGLDLYRRVMAGIAARVEARVKARRRR